VLVLGISAVLASGALAAGSGAQATAGTTQSGHAVVSMRLNGVVDPFEAAYIQDGISRAESDAAPAVLLTIDTPGGWDSSMRQITQAILNATVPVICYTAPAGARAASAGTFVMYACPVNAMAPGTNIGAAHPVGVSGVIEQTKVTNDAVAYIRSLAEATGRNADWAEQAVRNSVSISAEEAVRVHVADLLAPSAPALLDAVDGRTVTLARGATVTMDTAGAAVDPVSMSWGPAFLHSLIDPSLVFLFFFLGLILIVIELLHPGVSVPGVLGTLLLVTSVTSFGLLPVRLAGVVLLIASAVFFLFEFKHPGLGVPTVGGAICLVLGGLLLFNPAVPNARVSPWVIAAVAAVAVLFFAFVVKAALAARKKPVSAGAESMVGMIGVALTDLTPAGTVRVGKETWSATSASGVIPAGSAVQVDAVRGVHLVVEPVTGEAAVVTDGGLAGGVAGRETAGAEGGVR
jgi:membrane-bound serine protease (ClpP class)